MNACEQRSNVRLIACSSGIGETSVRTRIFGRTRTSGAQRSAGRAAWQKRRSAYGGRRASGNRWRTSGERQRLAVCVRMGRSQHPRNRPGRPRPDQVSRARGYVATHSESLANDHGAGDAMAIRHGDPQWRSRCDGDPGRWAGAARGLRHLPIRAAPGPMRGRPEAAGRHPNIRHCRPKSVGSDEGVASPRPRTQTRRDACYYDGVEADVHPFAFVVELVPRGRA